MERLVVGVILPSVLFWRMYSAAQDPFLAVTIANYNLHDIGVIDLRTEVPRNLSLGDLVEPVGVDYDPLEDKIYFSDRHTQIIGRVNTDGTGQETLLSFGDDARLEGIALNPWSRLLFWADAHRGAIFVSDLKFNVSKRLIEGNLTRPRGLVADLEASRIYWSEWYDEDAKNSAKIERATMSGDAREVIVAEDIAWPNGITIDETAGRLYWCDAYLDRIESVNLDGSNRAIILENSPYLKHTYSIALYGDSIYWTEARQNAVVKTSREGTNRTYSLLRFGGQFAVNGLAVSSYTMGSNACSRNNGGCFSSQLCLPEPSGRICACLESADTDETCSYRSSRGPSNTQVGTDSTDTLPEITITGCPGDTTITLATDKDSITVTWVEPIGIGPDGAELDPDHSHTPGDVFNLGETTVIYAYTYKGQISVCSFDVIVVTKSTKSGEDPTGLPGTLWVWVAGGAVILLFVILLVVVCICCLSCPRRDKSSRRDGNLIAMETAPPAANGDSPRRGSMNTLTSHTSLTVHGSFRKKDKNKKRNRKKKSNPTELVVHIPGVDTYEEMNGNRFVDGSTNHENSGRFNTMR